MSHIFTVHCVGTIEVIAEDKKDAEEQAKDTILHSGLNLRTVGVIDVGEYTPE